MAIVAAAQIHQVASQSHQNTILIVQVQGNRCKFKTLSTPGIRFFCAAIVFIFWYTSLDYGTKLQAACK